MNSYFYGAFLPLHLFFLTGLVYIDRVNWIWVAVFWVLLSGYGVGVALHRLLSHRAFRTSEWVKNSLSVLSCLCVQGSPIFWVAVHRGYHHRHSDKPEDIHSPVHGRWWAYFLWTCKIRPQDVEYKWAGDLLRSRLHLWLSDYYFPIVWCGWAAAFLISPELFLALVFAQIISLHCEFCVNLFCHVGGIPGAYRNYDTGDRSQNYWLFGVLCWGIGYHNNHHGDPGNPNFGKKWWELDLTRILIWPLPKK